MPTCDLCSQATGAGSVRLTSTEVKVAVRNGLRPPAQAAGLASGFGLDADEANRGWVDMAMSDNTDWVLCASCAAASARFRSSPLAVHAPPSPAAQPSPAPAVTAAATATAATDPGRLVEALATLLRAAAVGPIIPPVAVPVMLAMERCVERWRRILAVLGFVCFAGSFIVGIGIGGRTQSFWIGTAGVAGALGTAFVLIELLDRLFIMTFIRHVSRSHSVSTEDGTALFRQVRTERYLIRRIGDQAKGLAGKNLSSDFSKRIMEAALLAFLNTSMETVLAPSRDLAAKKEKWRPAKELSESAKETYSPVVSKCRVMVMAVQNILENREKLFETLDRIAACLGSHAGAAT
jgi:hypothetical protein